MTCDPYCGDGGPCEWCRHPASEHRTIPCRTCGGLGLVPDLTDRTPGPFWLKRHVPCGCAAERKAA